MYKRISITLLFVFLSWGVFCQSSALQSYMNDFERADVLGKIYILRLASFDNTLGSSAGILYEQAFKYALDNYENAGDYSDMNILIGISLEGLRRNFYYDALDTLWKLFLEYPDSDTKAEILITLGQLGKGNRNIVNNINNFLTENNNIFSLGAHVDYIIVSAGIAALLELGNSSSYSVLFDVLCAGYPEVIVSEAYGALDLIPGNLFHFLTDIIDRNPPEEKFTAFKAGITSERLSLSERGQIAELALDQALSASEETAAVEALRYSAILALTSLRWTRATSLATTHYYRVLTSYLQDAVSKDRLIEAIACLGAVGNSDAALALGLQLGLINARKESTGIFDAEITLAIVQALGAIGDNAAFDHLLYASNLSYGENITAAAREAIDRLRW